MFFLKKLIGALLMPYTMGMLLLGWGLWSSWRSTKPAGRVRQSVGWAILLLAGLGPVSGPLVRSLEDGYTPVATVEDLGDVRWIVVLGGGHTIDPSRSALDQLSDAAVARLTEGVRLHRLLPNSRLLMSGGGSPVAHATLLGEAAQAMGVDGAEVTLEERPRDTEEEARLIGERVGGDRMILVTSASHMTRALTLFRARGMNPVPGPTDFADAGAPLDIRGFIFPRGSNMADSEIAIHEYVGRLWAAIRIRVAT